MRAKIANRILLVWLLLLLVLGAAACWQLYQYLAFYEISRPEPVMDKLMDSMSRDEWLALVKDRATDSLSEFEDAAAILDTYYDASLRQANLSYRRDTVRSDGEHAVFVVRAGSVNLAVVTLGASEDGVVLYGRHLWSVQSIEPEDILSTLRGVSVEALAFPWQELLLNGKQLGEEYLVEENIPCPTLSELESRSSSPPTLVRYRVERMVGDISVTTAAGTVLPPESDGSVVRYDASFEPRCSVEFYAPADITVEVNGSRLSAEDAVSRSPGILEGLADYVVDANADVLHYVLDGLHSAPVVTARDADGSLLEPTYSLSGIAHYYHATDAACEALVADAAQAFFKGYLKYSMHNFSEHAQYVLLETIYPKTPLYNYIRDSRDTMIWAVETTADEPTELSFTDFHRVSEDCVVCNVHYRGSFTMNAKTSDIQYEEDDVVELCFLEKSGKYLCAAMRFLTD